MKKISTVAAKQSKNLREQKLTIGLDLGDRSSWYCVLDEAGDVLLEQKLGTTPKAMKEGPHKFRFTDRKHHAPAPSSGDCVYSLLIEGRITR